MATVTSLTKQKIEELLGGWDGIALSQAALNAALAELQVTLEENDALLEELNNVTLVQLAADLAANDALIANLNDNVLPELHQELDYNSRQLADLNTTLLPQLQEMLYSNVDAITELNDVTLVDLTGRLDANDILLGTLNDETIPTLQADVSSNKSQLQTLNDTTFPALNAAIIQLDGDLSNLDTTILPGLNDRLVESENKITDLWNGLIAAANAFNELDSELTTLNDETIPTLQADVSSNKSQLQTLNDTTFPALNAAIIQLDGDLSNLDTTILPGLNDRLVESENKITDLNDVKLPAIDAELQNHAGRLTTSETDISALEADSVQHQESISGLWNGLIYAGNELNELDTELQNHAGRLTTSETDISALETDSAQHQESITDLWNGLIAAANAFNELDSELTTLEGRFPITTTDISDGAITTPKMTANSINGDRILANTLHAGKIVAGSITTDRMTANSINGDRILADSINGDRILANTLHAGKIVAGSITTDRMTANSINGDRITAGTLHADKIVAGSITTDRMTANSINGDRILANTLHADKIVAGTITASKLNFMPATTAYVQSRGMNLVANGSGFLGSNYNFSSMEFYTADAPPGAGGSFASANPNGNHAIDEFLPVDTSKAWRFSFQAKQLYPGVSSSMYGYIDSYDIDKRYIAPYHVFYKEGTLTTLAADLKPGDTTVVVSSGGSNWTTTTPYPENRSIAFYDYTNSKGYTYPKGTYTRNVLTNSTTGAYAVDGISGNTITLLAPYSGPLRPAGTWVSNTLNGGTYIYPTGMVAFVPSDSEWKVYSSDIKGIQETTYPTKPYVGFRAGTAFVKVGFLCNYTPNVSSKQAVANVSLSEISSLNLPEIGELEDLTGGWTFAGTTEINGQSIRTGTIDAVKIVANSITANQIGANAITADELSANAVTANHISAGAVVAGKLSANAVEANNIAAGAVVAGKLAANSVTTNNLVAGLITALHISSGAITTEKIAANAIVAEKIAALQIMAEHIATDTITANKIAAGAITSSEIYAGAVVADKIASNAVTANHISAGAVVAGKLSANAVEANNIAAGAVVADKIASNAITANHISAGAVVAGKLGADAVTANNIAANAIVAEKIAALQIMAEHIATDTITANKIAAGAITSSEIYAGAVVADKIASNAITANHISAGAVVAGKLDADAVTANNIAANAITTNKIYSGSVTTEKIAARNVVAVNIATDTITANEIAVNAITASELSAGSVVADKIATNAVTTNKINAGAVTANEIAANAITTNHIAAGAITAIKIASGTITSDQIAAGSITASRMTIGDYYNLLPPINEWIDWGVTSTTAQNADHLARIVHNTSTTTTGQLYMSYPPDPTDIPVRAGEEFHFSWRAYSGYSGPPDGASIVPVIYGLSGSRQIVMSSMKILDGAKFVQGQTTSNVERSDTYVVPAEVAYIRVVGSVSPGGKFSMSKPILRRKASAELIVEGGIYGHTYKTNTGFDDIEIIPGNHTTPATISFQSDGFSYDKLNPSTFSHFDTDMVINGAATTSFTARLQGAKSTGAGTRPRIDIVSHVRKADTSMVKADVAYHAGGNNGWFGSHLFYVDGDVLANIDKDGLNMSTGTSIGVGVYAAFAPENGIYATGKIKTNVEVEAYGGLYDTSLTGGGVTGASIGTGGRIVRTGASSRRYKENIASLTLDEVKPMLEVRGVQFQRKDRENMGDGFFPGAIAEELDELGLDLWVNYDNKGRPDSILYSEMTIGLLMLLKDAYRRIERLEEKI